MQTKFALNSRHGRSIRARRHHRQGRAHEARSALERRQPRLGRFPNVKRWANAIAARPATARAYEIGESINTTPTVTEDSKALLFGQTGEKRAA